MPLLRRRLHPERLTGRSVCFTPGKHRARVIWRFTDGKPGHDNQSLGLTDALQRQLQLEIHDIPVPPRMAAWQAWLTGRFPPARLLPDPWLLVGAGRATQVPLLAARRARGGRVVTLMSPGLPGRLFDLCLIPEHDQPAAARNVLTTQGSLNRIQPVAGHGGDCGLILVGGPSRHFGWQSETIIRQVARIIRFSPLRHWVLATSRRTPAGFAGRVNNTIFNTNKSLRIVLWRDTAPGWLQQQLGQAACVWVTGDSVSMIYEALTARVPVGVLALPGKRDGRVVRGVQRLLDTQQVTSFDAWCRGRPLRNPETIYDEASRGAQWICTHWG